MRQLFLVFSFGLNLTVVGGQHIQSGKYWVTLAEKDSSLISIPWVSENTIKNRIAASLPVFQFSDIPVNKIWTDSIRAMGLEIVSTSRWLNAVAVLANHQQIVRLRGKSFVKNIESLRPMQTAVYTKRESAQKMHEALHQIGSAYLQKKNLTGKGVNIGLIDAGFRGADQYEPTQYLFSRGRIKATRDWIAKNSGNFFSSIQDLDNHGTTVLSLVGGLDTVQRKRYGLASGAHYYLCRTDHDVKENRLEMDYWVAALEWLDSCGVRLVNSSLGYATDFDDPAENFLPTEMNGKTSVVARASDIAFIEKGMLIIVSAGNDGDVPKWRLISTPADAQYNVAVGATDLQYGLRAGYSGMGPAFLPYVKPDLACYAVDGTSFSAPIITGLAACIWERYPTATNKMIREALMKSGHLYPFANSYIGYGIPDAKKALYAMECLVDTVCKPAIYKVTNASGFKHTLHKRHGTLQLVSIIHKADSRQVIAQEAIVLKRKYTLQPPAGTQFTTIIWSNGVEEVQWPVK